MKPAKISPQISDRALELIVLAITGLFYCTGAYAPWGWPSVDGYPAIERFIDPSFLTNDFYTNTTTAYNVDTLLAASLGFLQKATGFHYDVVLAALNLLRCAVWPFVLFQFFRALSGDRRLALIGALLGAGSLFAVPNLFAWGWLWGDPSTAMFAVVFITGGWALFLDRRPALSMLLFSAALLIHPLMAVHGGIFTALIYFVDYSRDEKVAALKSPAAWLSTLLFVCVFLAQYLFLSATPDERLPTMAYTHILAFVRHPTDFIPSLFSASDWISGILGSASAALILWKMKEGFPRWKLTVAGLVSYAIVCVCGYLFVEIHPVRFFVELIPFRYVIVGAPLMLYAFSVFAASEFRDGRWAAFLALAALFFLATPASRLGDALTLVAALIAAWIAWRLFTRRPAIAADAAFELRASPQALLFALSMMLLALSPAALYARRSELVIPRISNQHEFYGWANGNTPAESVFLVDQNGAGGYLRAIDPQRLRLVARRAVVASKDFPFLDQDISPWNERWQAALGGGVPHFVSKADADTLLRIADRFPFDYVVRDRPLADARFTLAASFEPSFGVGAVYVYRRR